MKQRSGFSIVELLISMGILGILLGLLSSFLITHQKVTRDQITHVTLENDTRLAFLRMSEVISQAQYIFPEGQALILGGKTFSTGSQAMAVLIPADTTYCSKGKSGSYCGYAFTVEDRTPFDALLGPDGGTSGLALIETFVQDLEWDKEVVPSQESNLFTWGSKGKPKDFRRSPITDSIDASTTNLMQSTKTATYSDFDSDTFDFSQSTAGTSDDLLLAIESKLFLQRKVGGKNLNIERSSFVFSRAIPRSRLPD
jgi:prepilin-type N-terminal cleavage/methylation domain-containing protein